jgi:glutathione synthase/RimK-type ligase-like ATP-grasp enzyme
MILFAGIPSEAPLQMAIAAAERLNVPHVVFNQRHSAHIDLSLVCDEGGFTGAIWLGGAPYLLDHFTGIYARTVEAAVLPEMRPRWSGSLDPAGLARTHALTHLFTDWLEVADACVVNRPSAMGSNLSKPFQAQLIRQSGLLTPETLISTDPEAVRAFYAEHHRIVYKSVSAVRSIVKEWNPAIGPELARVAQVPTQFQAFVTGVNVRVHVVGRRPFATEVISDAIDYRYSQQDGLDTTMVPTELPEEIAEACVRLTSRLGLWLSGIDLKRTPEGAWYCFEVNPSPAYSYFEELGGQPIAEALVRLLSGAD